MQLQIISPIQDRPAAVDNLQLEKNISCVNPEPKFPAASVRPGIMPNDRREIKGMIPNAAPQAA